MPKIGVRLKSSIQVGFLNLKVTKSAFIHGAKKNCLVLIKSKSALQMFAVNPEPGGGVLCAHGSGNCLPFLAGSC